MNKNYSRKEIVFYGDDAYEKIDRFVSMYEDLLETCKGFGTNCSRYFSTYTGGWTVFIWVTKENWQKILSSGLLQKSDKGRQGRPLWQVV